MSSTAAKRDGTQLSNAARMRLEDNLGQAEGNWERTDAILGKLANSLVPDFISKICFILLPFAAEHLYDEVTNDVLFEVNYLYRNCCFRSSDRENTKCIQHMP
jgi:hypothetical protein